MNLNHIAIAGVGALGASIGLSLKARGFNGTITGIIRSSSQGPALIEKHIVDTVRTFDDNDLSTIDLLVICTPVSHIIGTLVKLSPHLSKDCIVTDIGSVKSSIVLHKDIPGHMKFVGSHPMAGTEKSGFIHGFAGFYTDKPCILTPLPHTDASALNRVKLFWEYLGARVYQTDPAMHDAMISLVSHLPHVLSFAFMHSVMEGNRQWPDLLNLTGGSFRDFSRIAGSSPDIWLDILMENRASVIASIENYESHLCRLKANLTNGQADQLKEFISRASQFIQPLT